MDKKPSLASSCKLRSLTLKNFRIFKDITIDFQDLCAIVGKNNCGKSTILKALDVFFKDGKLTENDRNFELEKEQSDSNTAPLEITCSFDIDPEAEIILDAKATTTLKNEQLLDTNARITITKSFSKDGDLKTFIHAPNHCWVQYNGIECPLITLKNADLKKLCTNFGITDVDKSINKNLREAIREHLKSQSQPNKHTEIPITKTDKEDFKAIWNKLTEEVIPQYFLFNIDSISYIDDTSTSNFTKIVNQKILEDLKKELEDLQNNAKILLQGYTKEINKQIKLDSPKDIQNIFELKAEPNLKDKNISLFDYSFTDQKGIPIEQYGSGFNRQLLFSFFKTEAEGTAQEQERGRNIIYAIEEPETAQHPDWQLHLLETLQKLSERSNYQILFTTHTNEIVNIVNDQQIVWIKDGKIQELRTISRH